MSAEYWKDEKAAEIRSKHNVFRWYPQSKRLQVSYSKFFDKKGVEKYGKTVGVNIRDFTDNEPLKAFIRKALDL